MSDTASSSLDCDSDDSSEVSFPSPTKPPLTKANQGAMNPRYYCPPSSGSKLNAPLLPVNHKFNLMQKLSMRETFGKIKDKGRGPEMKVFSRLPGRLAFFIRDVVPQSALCAGHVFMGFSSCGQFLLSYTQTTTDSDMVDLLFNYYYRLHWWVFVPYSKAKKVAEVTLFTNQGVYGNLHISFCQWPGDDTRLVVYGYQTQEGEVEECSNISGSLHCYLTVTTAPSLNNCQDCIKVANSYDADDVAAAWNSCIRLSCLQHGATVHTQFDLVSPYPKFQPKISLKRDGCVVLNTGNFFHSLTVSLETLAGEPQAQRECDEDSVVGSGEPSLLAGYIAANRDSDPSVKPATSGGNRSTFSPPLNPISVNVGIAEFAMAPGCGSGFSSPPSHQTDSDYSVDHDVGSAGSSSISLSQDGTLKELNGIREIVGTARNRSPRAAKATAPYSSPNCRVFGAAGRGGASAAAGQDCLPDACQQRAQSVYYDKMEKIQEFASKLSSVKRGGDDFGSGVASGGPVWSPTRLAGGSPGTSGPVKSPVRPAGGSPGTSAPMRPRSGYLRSLQGRKLTQLNRSEPTVAPLENRSSDPFEFTAPCAPGPSSGQSERKRRLADAAYELTDDNFSTDVPEKLSTFRRKRLADKKYEFTDDEETENRDIVPLTRLRSQKMREERALKGRESSDLQRTSGSVLSEMFSRGTSDLLVRVTARGDNSSDNNSMSDDQGPGESDPGPTTPSRSSRKRVGHLKSPQSSAYSDEEDSSAIGGDSVDPEDDLDSITEAKQRIDDDEDCWADMLEGTSYPELFSPGGCIKKDSNTMTSPRMCQAMSPKVLSAALSPRTSNSEFYCRSKFTRRYIELDDEMISIITDIEDDDLGATTGFLSALPLEVHGSGYTQMHMIRNSKAEKLNLQCLKVEQRSLDLEQFCHETATLLCAASDKKFWFLHDYDVELVNVDPHSGDVVGVAVILVQAAILTKSTNQKYNVSSLSRKQYQAGFKFCWNIDSGQYHMVGSDTLKEVGTFMDSSSLWSPAKQMAAPLVRMFNCQAQNIRCLTNDSVLNGVSLKAIVDPDNLVALIMNDLE